jgi:hypothetical protein
MVSIEGSGSWFLPGEVLQVILSLAFTGYGDRKCGARSSAANFVAAGTARGAAGKLLGDLRMLWFACFIHAEID